MSELPEDCPAPRRAQTVAFEAYAGSTCPQGYLDPIVLRDEAAFQSTLACEGQPSEIDWAREELVVYVGQWQGRPGHFVAAYETDAGRRYDYFSARHCGGDEPESGQTLVLLRVPRSGADRGAFEIRSCEGGPCDWERWGGDPPA